MTCHRCRQDTNPTREPLVSSPPSGEASSRSCSSGKCSIGYREDSIPRKPFREMTGVRPESWSAKCAVCGKKKLSPAGMQSQRDFVHLLIDEGWRGYEGSPLSQDCVCSDCAEEGGP